MCPGEHSQSLGHTNCLKHKSSYSVRDSPLSPQPKCKNTEIMKDFNDLTCKAKRKHRQMLNPPTTQRPTDEQDLCRKPTTNNMDANQSHLGPKALEDAILAMKNEIADIE